VSEIKKLIDNAYNALPEVREARENNIREEAKKEAMTNTMDHELDLPMGGEGAGGEGGNGTTRRVSKTVADWGKGLGLSPKEIANVDPDKDPMEWDILDPTAKED
jgi:hypothetical protein